MKKNIFLVLFSVFFFACETEIDNYKVYNLSEAIVIYGEINNLSGPYSVRINNISSYSPYDIREFIGKPVENAKVRIEDNLGNVTTLIEKGNGLYSTPILFKGNVDQSYKLKISTIDGKEIESNIEKLKVPPILNEFTYKFIDAEKVEDMRFDIKATIKDPAETTDYYFVKKQEFIEFMTTCPAPPSPPAPPPPCYFRCWKAPLNTQPVLLTDFLVNGKNLPLSLASPNAFDWTDWIIQLDLHSVSKEIFEFWQRQEGQRTIGGGLFDKIPAQITGNLKCTSNSSQEVLGAFVVSGTSKQRLVIKRYDSLGELAFKKVQTYAEFNNVRFKDLPLLDCSQAAWIDYNLGYSIPKL